MGVGIPALAAVALLATFPAASAVAETVPAGFEPKTAVTSFRATIREGNTVERLAWRQPDWFGQRRVTGAAFVGDVVERAGTRFSGATSGSDGLVERRIFAARPDGYSFAERLADPVEFALVQARAGKLRLAAGRIAGRPAWRAKVLLHANKCAALARGTAEVWLDRDTLLPLNVVERYGRSRFVKTIRYTALGGVGASAFRPPPLGKRPTRLDYAFVRSSPAVADRSLSYTPLLPTALPLGFKLSLSGWAKRSGITGPEGSNPPSRELFAAVYRRGFERIDVTQRLSGPSGFPNDPFGVECGFQFESRVKVQGVQARYGVGELITSHLYWRKGRLVYTVGGPFPRPTLVAIANSLRPIR